MTITIGDIQFDHATYDVEGDVLYLRAGFTIVNARWLLERDGHITLTEDVPAETLEPVLNGSC